MIKAILLSTLLIGISLYADNNETESTKGDNPSSQTLIEKSNSDPEMQKDIMRLIRKKNAIDTSLKDNNVLSKIYSNYHTYKELVDHKEILDDQIRSLEDKYNQTEPEIKALEMLKSKRSIITG